MARTCGREIAQSRMGENRNKIYAEFDRKMKLSFIPLVFNFCCKKAVKSRYIICSPIQMKMWSPGLGQGSPSRFPTSIEMVAVFLSVNDYSFFQCDGESH